MQYGEKIATLRKSAGMTQAELGKALNVTFQAVSKWERCESLPDFETMSRMAKIFGVPIGYFEEGGEIEEETAEEETEEEPAPAKMLGVCKACGKVVNEGEEYSVSPELVCKVCAARRAAAKKKEAEEQAERGRAMARAREEEARAARRRAHRIRNRGLIVSAIIMAPVLAFLLYSTVKWGSKEDIGYSVLGFFVIAVCGYTYIAQLFWGGLIVDITLFSGKIIGTPGVIFSLDLDGVIFLIVVKVLFMILRALVYFLTVALGIVIAMIVAPFAFVPQMISCSRGKIPD